MQVLERSFCSGKNSAPLQVTMLLKLLRVFTLLLAALSLTMESAHVLELPQKLGYDPQMYAAVNGSLYTYFAIVGGVYQLGAIIAAFVLALAVRGRKTVFAWTHGGALLPHFSSGSGWWLPSTARLLMRCI